MQHVPFFVSNERPTHIVSLVKAAPPYAAKATARNTWNHTRGVLSIPPRARQLFEDTLATMEDLRWQLTQAATTVEHTWVLDAMAHRRYVAPRKGPREPSPPLAPTLVSRPSEACDIPTAPFLERAKQPMLHAQSQGVRLNLNAVVQAVAR